MSTIDEIVTRMPNAKVSSVLDASSGFWQIKLDSPSAKSCTFNTPFGRYMLSTSHLGSHHPRTFSRNLCQKYIEGIEVVVDEQHDSHLVQVLEIAWKRSLKLNKSKCQIKKDAITHIGHILSKDRRKPDPKKIEAIIILRVQRVEKSFRDS